MSRTARDIPALLAGYREAAKRTSDPSPRTANKWASRLHACYQLLREMEEGRNAITELIGDDDPHVRVWAAAHSLAWSTENARAALEELRESDGPCSLDAKWTLREFDRGKLSFDY